MGLSSEVHYKMQSTFTSFMEDTDFAVTLKNENDSQKIEELLNTVFKKLKINVLS